MYWVTLVDWYCSGLSLMLAAACEVACIAWVYGTDRFMYDIRCMIGYVPRFALFWQFMWTIITPIVILGLIIFYFVFYSAASYNGEKYPLWAEIIGWMTSLLSVLCVPGFAIYQTFCHPKAKGSIWERICILAKPDKTWNSRCPAHLRKEFDTKWSFLNAFIPGNHSNTTYVKGKESNNREDSEVSDPPPYNPSKV
jgi:solute carrier family 6 amino acid transporter-like protein 5/7/9/14